MRKQDYLDQLISDAGEIAVLSTSLPAEALLIAKKVSEKGIKALEIAYRDIENPDASDECIRAVREAFPDLLVGAATITSPALAKRAVKAGAQFILSAGFNLQTVKWCVKHNVPVYPGIATAGEIEKAMSFGLSLLKIFPVEVLGGIKYLKALNGPYPQIKFIVSGGISRENQDSYKNMDNVAAVSGSYLVK